MSSTVLSVFSQGKVRITKIQIFRLSNKARHAAHVRSELAVFERVVTGVGARRYHRTAIDAKRCLCRLLEDGCMRNGQAALNPHGMAI